MTWRVLYRPAYFAWVRRKTPSDAVKLAFLDWVATCANQGPPPDALPLSSAPDEATFEAMVKQSGTIVTYVCKPLHHGIFVREID